MVRLALVYTLSNFEIRRDVTGGRLRVSLQVNPKTHFFAVIPYTTRALYDSLPQIRNDITSNLQVGQSLQDNTM